MPVKTRAMLAVIAQAIVVVATVLAVVSFFTTGGEGNMQVTGWRAFRYFTIDSNVLAAIAGLACMPYEIRALRTGREELPHGMLIFFFAGTVAVSVTLMVVLGFLGPIYSYRAMFVGHNFWLHGANPVLAIVTFMMLLRGHVRFRETLWCLVPVLVYGAVYLVMVVIIGWEAGGWPDFYAFNIGGRWYVSFIAVGLLTFLLAAIERIPHRRA